MQKQVFISYSHDSEEHKAWVKKFADDLQTKGGIRVLLDQDLPKGASFTRFMQNGIILSDKVLVIGTPNYKNRSLSSGGVSYEGSIISADYMNDIDTTKYYPILRAGSFMTAFPPILAGRFGDDFTDDSKYEDKLKIVIEAINGEENAIHFLEPNHPQVQKPEAKINLNKLILFETMGGRPTGKIEGVALQVSITNLCNEPRFFYEPQFEFTDNIFDDKKAFVPTSTMPDFVKFPVRLEYGEVVSRTYILPQSSKGFFLDTLEKYPDTSFVVCAQNTLGNVYYSEFEKLSSLVKSFGKN